MARTWACVWALALALAMALAVVAEGAASRGSGAATEIKDADGALREAQVTAQKIVALKGLQAPPRECSELMVSASLAVNVTLNDVSVALGGSNADTAQGTAHRSKATLSDALTDINTCIRTLHRYEYPKAIELIEKMQTNVRLALTALQAYTAPDKYKVQDRFGGLDTSNVKDVNSVHDDDDELTADDHFLVADDDDDAT